jgi:hypothetical protein
VVTVTLWVAVVYLKGEALQLDMKNVKINMFMIPDSGFEAMLFFVPPCGIECQLHNTVVHHVCHTKAPDYGLSTRPINLCMSGYECYLFTGLQSTMQFKPPKCKRLQAAAPVK